MSWEPQYRIATNQVVNIGFYREIPNERYTFLRLRQKTNKINIVV